MSFYYNLLNSVPNGQVNNKSDFVQIIYWYLTEDKPLSEMLMAYTAHGIIYTCAFSDYTRYNSPPIAVQFLLTF